MPKEKKEVKSSVEDEKKVEEEKKEPKKSEEEETKVEEKETDEFEKKEEVVPVNQYNKAVRKTREIELEKIELAKQLEKTGESASKTKDVEKKEDSFFDDLEDEEEEEKEEEKKEDTSAIVDEKLKPVFEAMKKRELSDRKKDRTAFFEANPEYLHDAEKWNGLIEELNNSINPNSDDTYLQQLTKAHILYSGQSAEDFEIANKKKEMAGDAASGGDGAESSVAKEEFTAEDRKTMKQFDVSEDGMRAYKKKIKSGSMVLL